MWIKSVVSVLFLGISMAAIADHDDPSAASNQTTKQKPAKPTLAVGVTIDGDGRLWLARVENQRLLVSHSHDGGVSFSSAVVVTPVPEEISTDGENRPKIAVARDGTVLLSWTQVLPQRHSGNIRFSRSTDSGKTFSSPITLNDDGRITGHRFDALTIDGSGRVVVAWLDARDRDAARERGEKFSGTSIYTARSTDNGASFGANQKFQQGTCECCRIALTWTNEGPVAFWRNIFGVNTRDFAIANLDQGGLRRVTDDDWQIDACPHNGGAIAVDGKGVMHLTWFTNGSNRQGLFYKRIDGKRESQPMAIGNPATQPNHASVVAAGNTVILTWREFDGTAYSVQMMRSKDGGSSWAQPLRLMTSTGAADYPIPLADDKRMLVVWNTAAEGMRIVSLEERDSPSVSGKEAESALPVCFHGIQGLCVPVERKK